MKTNYKFIISKWKLCETKRVEVAEVTELIQQIPYLEHATTKLYYPYLVILLAQKLKKGTAHRQEDN